MKYKNFKENLADTLTKFRILSEISLLYLKSKSRTCQTKEFKSIHLDTGDKHLDAQLAEKLIL